MRRTLALGLALLAGGCGSPEPSAPDGGAAAPCDGRGETYHAGLAHETSGGITVSLDDALPAPPERFYNDWTLGLSRGGAPLTGAEVRVEPFMPDHGHGTPTVTAVEAGGGAYQADQVNLSMPGLWDVTVRVTPAGAPAETVLFSFCVEG